MATYRIEMEDATRYLPHNPVGRNYEFFVISGERKNPLTGEMVRNIVFRGSREECETFVERRQGRN